MVNTLTIHNSALALYGVL